MADLNLDLFIGTPTGNIPLSDRNAGVPLPQDPGMDSAALYYGPFLEALAGFFREDGGQRFFDAMQIFLGRSVLPEEIRGISLVSEKHGALYHVVRLSVKLSDTPIALAVNVAQTEAQKAFLDTEFALLEELSRRFALPHLPRPILKGETLYEASPTDRRSLCLFLAQWFDGFCEFHLSTRQEATNGLGVRVWDQSGSEHFLPASERHLLYREMAAILTGYFDAQTMEQIYPWHHAAGDFIVKVNAGGLDVRLVTARGYRALGDFPSSEGAVVIAALHFLFNMSLRMRLDRLDGTGELVWSGPECLLGIVEGFVRSWQTKCSLDEELPSPEQLLDLMSQFSTEDWLSFGELVIEDGMVEREETEYLRERLESHIAELSEVVQARIA